MTKSKYGSRKIVTDDMVAATVAWTDESLVFDIPAMTEYSAFSRKLLEVALSSQADTKGLQVGEDMIDRSMEFLSYSPVMNISAVMADPDFIRSLLTEAFTLPKPEAKVVSLLTASASPPEPEPVSA